MAIADNGRHQLIRFSRPLKLKPAGAQTIVSILLDRRHHCHYQCKSKIAKKRIASAAQVQLVV